MRLILNGHSTNDELTLVDATVLLNNAYSLASYGMQSVVDASGNNKTLGGAPTFDATGMITVAENNRITTGIMETDEMTFVVGINIDSATPVGNILSNVVPYSGIRLIINGGAYLSASVEVGNGTAMTSLNIGGGTGGWTVFAFSVSNSRIEAKRMSGASYGIDLPSKSKSPQPFFLNGATDSAAFSGGCNGKQGVVAVYSKFYANTEMMPLIENAKEVLRSHGVAI